MPRSFVRVAALAALLLSAGCASISGTPVGTHRAPPLAADAPVAVYSTEADVHAPFDVLGLLSYTNPGKWQVLSLADAMPPLLAQARELGADGVIIDSQRLIRSGLVSTGISVSARAIRVRRTPAAP